MGVGGLKAFSTEPDTERKTLSEKILEQDSCGETLANQQPKTAENSVFGFETLTYEQAQKEIESCSPEFIAQKTKKKPFTPTAFSPIPHENGFIPVEVIEQLEEPKDFVLKTEKEFSNPKKCKPRKNNEPPKKLLELFPGSVYTPPTILRLDDPDGKNANDEALDEKDYFEENKRYLASLEEKAKQDKIDVSSCEYVGKIFNTYLLYQKDGELLIIDQHAAHERLLFDKLKARMEKRERIYQPMLVPYELKLNAFEATFIRERLDDIRSMGFEVEESGETNFKVKAVPVDIPKIDVAVFFNHILGEVHSYRAIKMEDILKDKLAQAACKAAIKGGMDISRAEVDELFRQMDGNMGLKCPHGRPVVVKITKTELEKMFKRIV